jgi:hypothetical protein
MDSKDSGRARERPRPAVTRMANQGPQAEPRSKSAGAAPIRDPATGELIQRRAPSGMLANPWVQQYVNAEKRDDDEEARERRRATPVDAGSARAGEGGPPRERLRQFEESREPHHPAPPADDEPDKEPGKK